MSWRWDNIDWSATGSWAQAIGTFLAIWAAGRTVVLQQRSHDAATIRGIAAQFDVGVEVLSELQGKARDRDVYALAAFDIYRFDDVIRGLQALGPANVPSWRLIELVLQFLIHLRRARELGDIVVTNARRMGMPGPEEAEWLHDCEQAATKIFVEATQIFSVAQKNERWWWLR